MDIEEDISLWQRRVTEGPEGTARRLAAFAALDLRPGLSVLDIGCGGGHLVCDLALAVGEDGRAVGIDPNEKQLTAARELCANLPAAELHADIAGELPLGDGEIDGLASVQTREYVPDVAGALAECHRVLVPDGRAVFVSVLWDHRRFHGPGPALNEAMYEVWRAHCAHQMLPIEMPERLAAAGFGGVGQRPIAFMNRHLHESTAAFWNAKMVAMFAVVHGVEEAAARRWLDELNAADAEGRFAFVSMPILTITTAI